MPYYGGPGQRIAYDVYEGPIGAPPLLLLHGFTASSASFLSNVRGLRQHFTVITTDLLGHGLSESPDDPALYTPKATVARLSELIDHLGYDDVLLCGHSLGGAVALRFALDFPGKVAGLAVINSNSAAGTPEWREAVQPGLLSLAATVRAEGTGVLKDSRLYPAASNRLPADARQMLTADFETLTPAGVAGTAESLVVDVNAWERLPDLAVPTLIVIGDQDADFVAAAPDFLERLPARQTRWVTLKGAGHAANLESPEEFNAALVAFAEEIAYVEPLPIAAIAPAAAPARGGFTNSALTAVGSLLVIGGVALLVYALFFNGGDGTTASPGVPEGPTATPTTIDQVASERTPGPGNDATATNAPAVETPTTTESTETPFATPATTDTPTEVPPPPTPEPAPTQVPLPTATPIVEDEEPTPEQTPEPEPTEVPATPTPEPPTPKPGPFVAVGGPQSTGIGTQVTFSASAHESPDFGWRWSGCLQGLESSTCTASFVEAGCFPITAIGRFADGERASTHMVAVGGAVCQ